MTTNEIAVRQSGVPTAADMQASVRYAEHLANSGLLPSNYRRQPANVLYAIEYGRMVGLTPMAAITGVHVIEGKPSASAALISALVRRAGHKLRVRGDARSAFCQIIRSDDPEFPFEVTYTIEDARSAKLTNKEVWQKYPAAMLKARAISQCARDACEEALFGLHYTPEELGAPVDAEGLPVVSVQQAAQMARSGADAEADADTDGPTNGQLQQLAMRVTDKFGITDRPARLVVLSELLGRQIASMRELSYEDAEGLLGKLHQLPDHIADAEYTEGEPEPVGTAPNPRNGDNRPPLDPALFVPPLRQLVDEAAIEPGLSVYDALRKMISEARTEATLKRLFQVATEAVHADEISAADFARLDAMGQEKNAELTGPARPQSSDAPDEAQYEVRDRLAGRIKSARTPEQFTDVYGALVEARDAGTITQIQHDALVTALDDRYKTVSGESGPQQADQGWSHRRIDQMAGAAQS